MLLLDKLIPPPSQEEEVALIIRGQKEQNALGLTSSRELTLWPQAMRAYYSPGPESGSHRVGNGRFVGCLDARWR